MEISITISTTAREPVVFTISFLCVNGTGELDRIVHKCRVVNLNETAVD